MATLNLPDASKTLVWRVLRDRIRADPTLALVVPTLQFFGGEREASADLTQLAAPALRFYPTPGPMAWFDEGQQYGPLIVHVEAWIAGLDVEDVLNLQNAVEAVFWPPDIAEQLAFQAELVAAGAVTGYIVASDPLAQPQHTAGLNDGWHPLGRFTIDCLRRLIPTS